MRPAAPPVLEVDLGPGLRAAFTLARRPGAGAMTGTAGLEGDPHAGFNLSAAVGDARDVPAHRSILGQWIGVPVAYARQVHGARVHVCAGPPEADDAIADADALVTTSSAVAVAVLVADCVPVLLADPGAGVVAAVHAGRRGLVAGVLPAAVRAMVAQGARPAAVNAAVGPAVCGACYEVPVDLQREVDLAVPGTASTTSWGTPSLDLVAGVRSQLEQAGVRNVAQLGGCTLTDDRWYSHRAALADPSRAEGRFAAVVRLLPGARVSPSSGLAPGLA